MEDGISMATKRQITLRFRDEYMKASKKDKGRILDEMCSVLAIGRSTARRRLAEAGRGRPSPPPEERLKRYSEQSRDLLVRVWLMMDLPCAKYLKAMLPTWLPMLRAHGELADYDGFAFLELEPRGKQSNSTPPPLTKGDSSVQYSSSENQSRHVISCLSSSENHMLTTSLSSYR